MSYTQMTQLPHFAQDIFIAAVTQIPINQGQDPNTYRRMMILEGNGELTVLAGKSTQPSYRPFKAKRRSLKIPDFTVWMK